MPTVSEFMAKLNANERLAVWGAVIVFVASLLGGGWIALIGSAVVVIVYWLKYSPTSKVTWPAPVQLINLAISAIIGVLALVGLLGVIGFSSIFGAFGIYAGVFGGIWLLVLLGAIIYAVGGGMMFLGTWREYQAMPKASPPAG